MPDENGAVFPQKIDSEISSCNDGNQHERTNDLSFFTQTGCTLFMRPDKIISAGFDGRRLSVLCRTQGYISRKVQTHETEMFQLQKVYKEKENGILNLEIQIWSDSIFRVRYSKNTIDDFVPDFPPASARMLSGSPEENVLVVFNDDE